MTRRSARLFVLALGALGGGCTLAHQDVAMQGNADGVIINYFGDIAETLPLARQHCARYERVPVLHQTQDNNAIYFCVRAGPPPAPAS
jgi:hypothetical protein